jgi:signal transduction histidine kinase
VRDRDSHVVLIADEPGFTRELMARWQSESSLPGITAMSTDLLAAGEGRFDLAIICGLRNRRLASVLKVVEAGAYPVICLVEDAAQMKVVKAGHPRVLVMQRHHAWIDAVLLLANECLKRVDLAERLRRAERAAQASSRGVALGRYVLESRHDLNNSLTSVLGNAELLLLDAAAFPEPVRDQLQTIHEMALHVHEIMQRFSSVAAESRNAENSSQDETEKLSHAASNLH